MHQGNVGITADCTRVVSEVLAGYGQVDFLVNNAGITVDKTVRKMSVEDWHAVMQINISGAFYMMKAVLDHMLERGRGRIVNLSSVIGQTGNIGQANYAASKAALYGLTQSLALETARKGITVNCVAPGFIADRDGCQDPPADPRRHHREGTHPATWPARRGRSRGPLSPRG